ncbi:MAG: hypothetical protein VB081_02350 [Christensenella sp.]|uniref:hypothetical protein n=1 Tax=Christensenella sp. TaxID=1935934 RepID=UPI002B221465|nr:hypothetical protein [Christensenella sp.]MEA5002320.1 hypothetical protein [Christensenella sp.]
MIQLIYAPKGSGKTKRLIDLANAELNSTKGEVVFIDDDKRYMYDVAHQARFVDVKDFGIESGDALYGMLCGMVSQNYDIEAIFIDAFLKIVKMDVTELKGLMDKISSLCEKNDCKAVIIISADPSEAPDFLKPYII